MEGRLASSKAIASKRTVIAHPFEFTCWLQQHATSTQPPDPFGDAPHIPGMWHLYRNSDGTWGPLGGIMDASRWITSLPRTPPPSRRASQRPWGFAGWPGARDPNWDGVPVPKTPGKAKRRHRHLREMREQARVSAEQDHPATLFAAGNPQWPPAPQWEVSYETEVAPLSEAEARVVGWGTGGGCGRIQETSKKIILVLIVIAISRAPSVSGLISLCKTVLLHSDLKSIENIYLEGLNPIRARTLQGTSQQKTNLLIERYDLSRARFLALTGGSLFNASLGKSGQANKAAFQWGKNLLARFLAVGRAQEGGDDKNTEENQRNIRLQKIIQPACDSLQGKLTSQNEEGFEAYKWMRYNVAKRSLHPPKYGTSQRHSERHPGWGPHGWSLQSDTGLTTLGFADGMQARLQLQVGARRVQLEHAVHRHRKEIRGLCSWKTLNLEEFRSKQTCGNSGGIHYPPPLKASKGTHDLSNPFLHDNGDLIPPTVKDNGDLITPAQAPPRIPRTGIAPITPFTTSVNTLLARVPYKGIIQGPPSSIDPSLRLTACVLVQRKTLSAAARINIITPPRKTTGAGPSRNKIARRSLMGAAASKKNRQGPPIAKEHAKPDHQCEICKNVSYVVLERACLCPELTTPIDVAFNCARMWFDKKRECPHCKTPMN
ncbi:hypothetical protein B0H13DRAFT_1925663 [Mycena leptocephala]|nr:hypothetical protein B0H13DRAFT_1925663 [Mycena leptocephala]